MLLVIAVILVNLGDEFNIVVPILRMGLACWLLWLKTVSRRSEQVDIRGDGINRVSDKDKLLVSEESRLSQRKLDRVVRLGHPY